MNICLIGYNLTNFLLAILLSKKGFEVDIIFDEKNKSKTNNRTIGISKKNIEFLKSILNIPNQYLWPILQIEILNLKNDPSKKIKFKDKKDENFFLIKQSDLLQLSVKKCKQLKNIYFSKYTPNEILKLEKTNNYNLIVNSQPNNILIKKFFSNSIKKDYDSMAFTAILSHKKINNHTAVQVFTKYGPLAFLPLSGEKTSIVYSVQKKFGLNSVKVKDEILKHSKFYNLKKISELENFDLKYSFPRKFVHKNILCFGDALHKIHPLAGQGFNMTIRDVKILLKIIESKKKLGLPLDSSVNLEFEKKTRHKNFIFTNGVDFIYEFFNLERKTKNNILSKSVQTIGKSNTINKVFKSLADRGIYI